MVHDGVAHTLHILVLALSRVLVLLVRFTLPISNDERAKDVLNTATDLDLCTITDKLGGGSTMTDNILEDIDECLFCLQGINITDRGC